MEDNLSSITKRYLYKKNITSDLKNYIKIVDKWEDIIGEGELDSFPYKYENGILFITTKDSIISNEISMLSENIKQKISYLCNINIKSIRTKVGEVKDIIKEIDRNDTTNDISYNKDIVISDEEKKLINSIKNDKLKDKFKKIIESSKK